MLSNQNKPLKQTLSDHKKKICLHIHAQKHFFSLHFTLHLHAGISPQEKQRRIYYIADIRTIQMANPIAQFTNSVYNLHLTTRRA